MLGTMVWDLIDHPEAERVERWGGIAYSLAAAAAALPDGWSLRPIIKIGSDLADLGFRFVASLPGVESPGAMIRVPGLNNRVHLRYRDRHHRHECLTGGVPAWTWEELAPRLDGLDALFVNLISGFELELETAQRLRSGFRGPIYADLHSLLLGEPPARGPRQPRPLPNPYEWLACFDVIQVNETELALVAGEQDPWQTAREAVRRGAGAVLVTLGPDGATWVAAANRPRPWQHGALPEPTPVSATVPVETPWPKGDPTGCGDVWGATCFIHLVRGRRISDAVAAANRVAARNATHRGADGLYPFLRGGV